MLHRNGTNPVYQLTALWFDTWKNHLNTTQSEEQRLNGSKRKSPFWICFKAAKLLQLLKPLRFGRNAQHTNYTKQPAFPLVWPNKPQNLYTISDPYHPSQPMTH
eukprot:90610_1